ncbi:MAG: FHA domain-containing protein [Kiritimatiellae bacterium]|nr:FHA domain-containing protein [Kiritimatiellia bacterium]
MNLKITFDVNGENRVYLFGEVTDITIGREDDNLISPILNSISRHHAKIFFKDSEWFVQDLNSTNGSFLNDKKIDKPEKLSQGDTVRFGELKIAISFCEPTGVKQMPAPAVEPVVPEKFDTPVVVPQTPAPVEPAVEKLEPVVDDIPELPPVEEKPAAAEPPKAISPISPISPIKPALKKPVLGGGLKAGLKLPPKPNAMRPGLKLPPKPAVGLKPGLKLPGKTDAEVK